MVSDPCLSWTCLSDVFTSVFRFFNKATTHIPESILRKYVKDVSLLMCLSAAPMTTFNNYIQILKKRCRFGRPILTATANKQPPAMPSLRRTGWTCVQPQFTIKFWRVKLILRKNDDRPAQLVRHGQFIGVFQLAVIHEVRVNVLGPLTANNSQPASKQAPSPHHISLILYVPTV